MYCKKCGCPISEDAVFCKKCGEKQHQGIESAAVHSHQGKDFLKKFSVVFHRVFRTTASKIIAGVLAAAILVTGIAVIVNNQNKNRFASDSISVVVEPTLKYDNVSSFSEGFAVVEKDKKYGYVDQNGKEVVPPRYYSAGSFSDGVAVAYSKEDCTWHIIDKTGNVKAQLKGYDNVGYSFSNGFIQVEKDDKYGLADTAGKEVLPPVYDSVQDFNEGLAQVQKDSKYGFVDQTGKEVVPLIYDSVDSFSDGLARVEKDGKYNYIDKTGKEVVPSEYDLGWGEFSEGFADVKKGKKYGYIDKNGNVAVPMIYDETREFSEGLAWVRQGKKWGILKINESTLNNFSSTATSDVPTTSNSTDTNTIAINIDDYVGKWHIAGQNYDSDYHAYEKNLSIRNEGEEYLIFQLFYFRLGEITSIMTLNGNIADFAFDDGATKIKGTLTFNENSITVNIESSNLEYMPVETMTFDSKDIYYDGICPRCGREITYGNSCDCTWCDICNAWMGGHGHEDGEQSVDSNSSESSNDSNSAQNGTGSTVDYDYSFEGNEITITRYKGSGGDVVIPATIDGKRITVIGETAFSERFDLTSVTIPASVISIRDRSFDFSHFKSIYFEGNAPPLEDYAWEKLNYMWDVFYYKPGTTGWTSPPWDAYDKETW